MNRPNAEPMLLSLLRRDRAGSPPLLPEATGDWDRLLEAAERHQVTALLHHRLRKSGLEGRVPPSALEAMRRRTLLNAGTNLRLYQELGRLALGLREHGVEAIALKGAHLAAETYESVALRQMADLDLLVRKSELPRVAKAMAAMGYSSAQGDTVRLHQHLPPLVREGFPLPVEIHFTIVDPPLFVPEEELFARAQRRTLEGVDALTLAHEDLLLHLCAHGAAHHAFCTGLKGVFDFAVLLERVDEGLDWGEVVGRGRRWGLHRALCLSLSLARELAGAPVPGAVLAELSLLPGAREALHLAEEMVFAQEGEGRVAPGVARLAEKRGWARVAHLARPVFLPPSGAGRRGSFVARVTGLWARHGGTLWGWFRGNPRALAAVAVEARRNQLRDWLAQG